MNNLKSCFIKLNYKTMLYKRIVHKKKRIKKLKTYNLKLKTYNRAGKIVT